MAKITTAIPAQSFEVVRDRIAEILIDELDNQVAKFYKEELNAKVHIERFIPFDDSELPVVNVGLARGDFDNQTTIDSDGTYRYNIDCYHSAKSTKDVRGDTLANKRLQTLVGACRAILESSQYIRLNFPPPFIMNRQFENIAIAEPAEKKDTISVVMARLTFTVRVPENVDVTSANLIAGFDTQVKLALTEKGYIYSGDNIPVPPVTDGSVTVNDDFFDSVAPGDIINVPVENTYGDLLGSLIGGKWIIANTRYIDSDGLEKFRPAGETIFCSPIDISALTCAQLNADLTQPQRQLIHTVNPLKTGATVSATPNDDGANQKGRLVDFLTLDCNHPFSGDTIRMVDSLGGQSFDGTGAAIPWYMLDLSTGIAYQFNANFTSFGTIKWIEANAAATAHDNGTFSDFALPNINEAMAILNHGAPSSLLNYVPLNKPFNFEYWTSTENHFNTLFAWAIQTRQVGLVPGVQKIGTKPTIYVRNHF